MIETRFLCAKPASRGGLKKRHRIQVMTKTIGVISQRRFIPRTRSKQIKIEIPTKDA